MQKPIFGPLLATGLFFVISLTAHAAALTHEALREELLKMRAHDQEVREASSQADFNKQMEVDAHNQKRLKEIVNQYGWPMHSMVGENGAHAAWLIAQHSDSDKDFQQRVLGLMEPLVKQGEASGKDYAYLYDRTHHPQRFGTQGTCVSRDAWQPFQIDDIANVEQRRRLLGLPSLAAYAKLLTKVCARPTTTLQSASDPKRTVPIPR